MLTFATVIPNRNGGEHFGRALTSLLRQTRMPNEIAVVDHGSTDQSLALVAKFEKELKFRAPNVRFTLVRYDGFIPVAKNWNRAASHVTTDYFHIFHADDELDPAFYQRCEETFRQHPETDLLSTKIDPIDDKGHPAPRPRNRIKDPLMAFARITGLIHTRLFLLFFGMFGTMIYCPTAVFRRSFFERIGGFNPEFSYCVDFEMWIRCIRMGGRYRYIPQPLYRYRLSSASITVSQRFDAKFFEEEFRAYHLPWVGRPWLRPLSIPALTAVFLEDLAPLNRETARVYTRDVTRLVPKLWALWLTLVSRLYRR